MPRLTAEQVAGIASVATPSGTTVAQWVKVARDESGFDTGIQDFAHSGHWGLWQVGADHWQEPGMPAAASEKDFASMLTSPLINWTAAKVVYSRQGWGAWTSVKTGQPIPSAADNAAASHVDKSVAKSGAGDPGAANPISVTGLPGIGSTLDALKAAVEPLQAASKWLGNPHNWQRLVQVTGGILLGLVAVSAVLNAVSEPVVNSPGFKKATKAVAL